LTPLITCLELTRQEVVTGCEELLLTPLDEVECGCVEEAADPDGSLGCDPDGLEDSAHDVGADPGRVGKRSER